jgi:hypothetical protein
MDAGVASASIKGAVQTPYITLDPFELQRNIAYNQLRSGRDFDLVEYR